MTLRVDAQIIRDRLKNGDTIETICKEYDMTLSDLVDLFWYYDITPRKHDPTRPKSMMYIRKNRDGKFVIVKSKVHFGTYVTLSDAKKIRNYMLYHGWIRSKLDDVCMSLGVERCKR